MTPVYIGGESFAKVQAFTASGTITNRGGRIVTFAGAASQTLTLPAAVVGSSFEIWNIDSSDGVAISRAGSDTITDNLSTGATTFNVPAGAKAVFECVSAGVWHANYLTMVAAGGSFTPAAGTGTKSVTGVGFRPKVVTFSRKEGASASYSTHTQGYMDAWGNQSIVVGTTLETTPAAAENSSESYAFAYIATATASTLTDTAAFSSMDVDGFTLNYTNNANELTVLYRAWA